ncbi:MAG TPA: phosphatidate cytidylyltransferase [Spirillospora sp.]
MRIDDAGGPVGSPDEPEIAESGTDPDTSPEGLSSGPAPTPLNGARANPSSADGAGDGEAPASADGSSAGAAAGDSHNGTREGKAGRNLPLAAGVGVALGGLVLLSLYTIKEIFLVVLVAFLFLGMREVAEAFKRHDINVPFIPVATGMVGAPVVSYVWGATATVAAVALTVLALLVTRMLDGPTGYVRDATAGTFLTGYLALIGSTVALLLRPDDGDHRIVIFIAITVASDTGGYFAGAFLGKHKMAPTISPKKTWEGLAGSAASCMVVGGVLVWRLLDGGHLWQGVLVGLAGVLAATAGDLVESMVKRDLGIKDMGTLLPGHGGVMDRIDSLVATAPVVWLLLELFVPS